MKASPEFKEIIQKQLQVMAENDKLFAESLKKENKNIDDCLTYIINTVKATGCIGFSDAEIFGMAAHYYDEDDIKVGKPVKCQIVTNHSTELSEEEKAQAKDEAKKQAYKEEVDRQKARLTKKRAKQSKENESTTQTSLFG